MLIKNNTKATYLIFAGVVLVLIAILAFSIHFTLQQNAIGNDILIFYLAAKSSFIDGQGPYVPENAIQSQILSTGKLAQTGDDYLNFNYPPYALIFLFPLVYFTFEWVQAIWMATWIVVYVVVLLISFPQTKKWLATTILFLYPITFGLLMGNFVIPIGIILIANLKMFFFNNQKNSKIADIALAIFLAWATVKPQFSWLYISFILLATLRYRKFRFLITFTTSLLIFLGISFLILPDWIERWMYQIRFFIETNPTELQFVSILNSLTNGNFPEFLEIPLIVLCIFWILYTFFQWWNNKIKPLYVIVIIGWVSYLLYPGGVDYQQIVFLLPFIIWILTWKPTRTYLVPIIWVLVIFFSWLEFYFVRILGIDPSVRGWLFYGYLIWAIILLFRTKQESVQKIAE